MSSSRTELEKIVRYAGTGVVNTLVGFAVIFCLMASGVSPLLANVLGYACGLVVGFIGSRRFVFASKGNLRSESALYLASFLACFGLNLLVLEFAQGPIGAYLAQVLAAIAYCISMYLCSRLLVFRTNGAGSSPDKDETVVLK